MPTRGSHRVAGRARDDAATDAPADETAQASGPTVFYVSESKSAAIQSAREHLHAAAVDFVHESGAGFILLSEKTEGEWTQSIVEKFQDRVAAMAHEYVRTGAAAPSVAEVVDLATAVLPTAVRNPLDVEIGPFYNTAGVQALLDVTKQGVEKRRAKHTILALRTADGRWVYPVWQFDGRQVNPSLIPAFQALAESPPWSSALWFVTENPDLDGATPLQWLRDDLPAEQVLASAKTTAREWH